MSPWQNTTVVDTELTWLTQPTGNFLVWVKNAKVYPGQVSTPKISKNHLTISFNLKPGLQWNNGQPITNLDYKFKFNIASNKNTGPAFSAPAAT